MTMPSFTADASLYHGKGFHRISGQWPAAGAVATLTPQQETPEGFGCPLNAYECHRHCQSVGYRGGYCEGFFRHRCRCYG
jgi:hypothetical protein